MGEVSEQRVAVNDLTFNVASAGEGPPVLLLHGFPDNWRIWRHQVQSLSDAGYRVLAPDLRGFGDSSRPDGVDQYKMRNLVLDVAGLLDAYALDRVSLVGHDWGAALAWAAAAFLPDRVESLAAVSVGHPNANLEAGLEQRRLSWYMLWFLFPGVAEEELPRDEWRFFREWAWPSDPQGAEAERQIADLARPGALTAALNWYRANIRPEKYVASDPSRSSFPNVTCPTMGVWSSGDFALSESQMSRSGEYVDGPWRYERIEDVDHWVPVNAADRLNDLLRDFLGDRR